MSRLLIILVLISACKTNKTINKRTEVVTDDVPNIVYILADDMGYGDLSGLNPNSGIQTPNMDKIINNGVHFTDAHTNSSVCTPTRYGIITGRYAWRSSLKKGVLKGYSKPLIEDDRPTIASYLKKHRYNTACIGKWHIGLGLQTKDDEQLIVEKKKSNVDFNKKIKDPSSLGFDYSYIIPASLDMPPYVYIENGKALELPIDYTNGKNQNKSGRGLNWRSGEKGPSFNHEKTLDNFTKKTANYIINQKNEENSFFVYFALTAPHTPWLPVGDAVGKSNAGDYGDFVTMVDDAVGAVVTALEKSGQLDNTLIIVTSDNGAHWKPEDKKKYVHRANYIYKGQKADIYEGGHRVPYIAQWPGVIPAGHQSNQTMCTTDLFSTLSGILNNSVIEKGAEDSYNLWPAYLSNVDKPIREAIVHHSYNGMFSIRKGKWKFTPSLGSGGFTKPKSLIVKENESPGTLYDLVNDPSETKNLYKEYPEIVSELELLLEKYKTQGYSNNL